MRGFTFTDGGVLILHGLALAVFRYFMFISSMIIVEKKPVFAKLPSIY